MSVNLFRWHSVIKDLVCLNKIHARQFSALTKCHKTDDTFLIQTKTNLPNIQPFNRRDFIGFVPDPKDGYKTQKELTDKEHAKLGFKQLKTELKLWTEELKEDLRSDPMTFVPPGENFK